MFIVTSYVPSDELKERKWNLEGLIDRRTFVSEAKKIVPNMLRAGQRFFEVYKEQLSKVEQLSTKVAISDATDEERQELDALRAYISSPFIDSISSRTEWVDKFKEKLDEFEELQKELQKIMEEY